MSIRLSKKEARVLAREETKSSKEYAKMGLKQFSHDEARHAAFFKMQSKRKGR